MLGHKCQNTVAVIQGLYFAFRDQLGTGIFSAIDRAFAIVHVDRGHLTAFNGDVQALVDKGYDHAPFFELRIVRMKVKSFLLFTPDMLQRFANVDCDTLLEISFVGIKCDILVSFHHIGIHFQLMSEKWYKLDA